MVLYILLLSLLFVANNFAKNPQTVVNKLTIITATSPIRSNPKTDIIEATQKSFFIIPALRECKKIIVFDGVNENGYGGAIPKKNVAQIKKDYELYKQKIIAFTKDPKNPYFKNTTLLFLDEWKHLTGALQEAMKLVTTPFVYVHQHDFKLIREFDIENLIRTMEENPRIKNVRLGGGGSYPNFFDGPVDNRIEGKSYVPLLRTFKFADPEHITTVKYYEELIFPRVKHPNYPESIMEPEDGWEKYKKHQQEIQKNHALWGTYIYDTLTHNKTYYQHLDGRFSE